MAYINVSMPDSVRTATINIAKEADIPYSEIVKNLIMKYLPDEYPCHHKEPLKKVGKCSQCTLRVMHTMKEHGQSLEVVITKNEL